jgi:hypothetical protein
MEEILQANFEEVFMKGITRLSLGIEASGNDT